MDENENDVLLGLFVVELMTVYFIVYEKKNNYINFK